MAGVSSAAVLAASPAPVAAAPSDADKASKLQRAGEDLYDADDFEGARRSWLAAFDAVEVTYEQHNTLVTLLVLAASATLEHHARADDLASIEGMLGRIVEFESTVTDLDPELSAMVADERRRLQDVLDHAEATATPDPAELEDFIEPADEAAVAPSPRPWAPFVIGGGVALAGGVASIAAGAAFGPRARGQVEGSSDPESRTDAFVRDERNKGLIWVGVGSALVVTGAVLLTIGLLRRARGRDSNAAWRQRPATPRVMLGGVRW